MADFFAYFFGAGETQEFTNFTLPHFLPILIAAGVIYLIYRFRNQIRELKKEQRIEIHLE